MTRILFRGAENGSKGDDGAENGAHDRTKEGAAGSQRGEFCQSPAGRRNGVEISLPRQTRVRSRSSVTVTFSHVRVS